MNIDERLDRLTERHEALTQSVELLMADNRQMAIEWEKRHEKIWHLLEGVIQSIDKLVRIAENHEQRLRNLEGGPH